MIITSRSLERSFDAPLDMPEADRRGETGNAYVPPVTKKLKIRRRDEKYLEG